MRQIKTFSDERLNNLCAYCGDAPGTRDHVPSKILLNSPFPENLPVVPCCDSCNQGFSLDEEYFACSIECILHGTTDIGKLSREKIKSIFSKKQKLKELIDKSFMIIENKKFFKYDQSRFENVMIKLAKGHLKFENSDCPLSLPTSLNFLPLMDLSDDERDAFLTNPSLDKAPEIGSRSSQQLFITDNDILNPWIVVQEDVYSYSVVIGIGILIVKIIVWNYLAIEVVWEEQ